MNFDELKRLNNICCHYIEFALTDSFALHKLIIQLQVHRSDVLQLIENMRLAEDLFECHERYRALNPDSVRTALISIDNVIEMFRLQNTEFQNIAVAWIIVTAHKETSYLFNNNVHLDFQIPDNLQVRRRLKVGNIIHYDFRKRKAG